MNDQPENNAEENGEDLSDLLAALNEVTQKEQTQNMTPVADDGEADADEDASEDEAPSDDKPAQPRGDMLPRAHMTQPKPADTGDLSARQPTSPARQTGPAIRVTPPTPSRPTPAPDTPKFRYRIAVVLSPQLELQLNAARQSVSIPVARPGIFALQEDFETSDIDAVQAAITSWAEENLPLTVEVERVVAEVIGEQRYLAGFALEPAGKLNAAQQALAGALANSIRPISDDALPFAPRLPVSDHTPAVDFPRLIHELQKRFEAAEWAIEAVELLRVPEDDDRWEVVQKF